MALETGNYVGDLTVTNPAATDVKSQGDDHLRLIKTALRQSFPGFAGAVLVAGTNGGSADTYTLTPTTALVSYVVNMIAVFSPAAQNTGASTLNISGLGAKNLKTVAGAALSAADLVVGYYYLAVYDGTEFRLIGVTKRYVDGLAFSTALPNQSAGTTNYIIQSDGTNAAWVRWLGKNAVWIPASAMIQRTTNGAAPGLTEAVTNKVMLSTLDFDQSTIEYAQFSFRMPKSWDEGTVTAVFAWTSGVTGNVIWGIQGLALSDDDVIDTAFGTAVEVTDAVTAITDIMHSAETSAMTIAGSPAAQDLVVFQVYRKASDGGDTAAGDAKLIGVTLYLTTAAGTDD